MPRLSQGKGPDIFHRLVSTPVPRHGQLGLRGSDQHMASGR